VSVSCVYFQYVPTVLHSTAQQREGEELESSYSTVTVYRKVEQANRIPPSSPPKSACPKGLGINSQDLSTR
jgi:hypothetical protein